MKVWLWTLDGKADEDVFLGNKNADGQWLDLFFVCFFDLQMFFSGFLIWNNIVCLMESANCSLRDLAFRPLGWLAKICM